MKPFEECPRFYKCSVNKCPLDPDINIRNRVIGEEKCHMRKSVRNKIGLKYLELLKFQGFTSREHAGKVLAGSLPSKQ